MSKITTDKLRTLDGTKEIATSTLVKGDAKNWRGSAKAWVNFKGQNTVFIRNSLGVSSLTDNGTGNYTTHWSCLFAGADYSCVSDSAMANQTESDSRVNGVATSYVSLLNHMQNSPYYADPPLFTATAHGDLA